MSKQKTEQRQLDKSNSYQLFNRISRRYDFLNHFLSAGLDISWRKKAVRHLSGSRQQIVLDLASGTGDLILTALRSGADIKEGIALDPARLMLSIGAQKIQQNGFARHIRFIQGDGTHIPFGENTFDAAMIAFGIRNVADFHGCLRELLRVLKPGGRVIILEFSLPENAVVRTFYLYYFRYVLPVLGGMISGDFHAYRYLNQTVENFYYGKRFCAELQKAGFVHITMQPLTFGVATIYSAEKRLTRAKRGQQ